MHTQDFVPVLIRVYSSVGVREIRDVDNSGARAFEHRVGQHVGAQDDERCGQPELSGLDVSTVAGSSSAIHVESFRAVPGGAEISHETNAAASAGMEKKGGGDRKNVYACILQDLVTEGCPKGVGRWRAEAGAVTDDVFDVFGASDCNSNEEFQVCLCWRD